MVSSKDAKEVGNREHHTHSGICVAFHLRFAAEEAPALAPIIHHLNVKTVSKVDEQVVFKLACEGVAIISFFPNQIGKETP